MCSKNVKNKGVQKEMNSKKKWIVIASVAGAVLVAVAIFICVLVSKINNKKAVYQLISESIHTDERAEKYAEKHGDLGTLIDCNIMKRVEITITDQSNDYAIVKISAPDMKELMNRDNVKSDEIESYEKNVVDALKNGDYNVVENTVKVNIVEENGKKDLEITEEYVDAVYGGLYSMSFDVEDKTND